VSSDLVAVLRTGYRAMGLGAPAAVLRMFEQTAVGDANGWFVREITSTVRYATRPVVADDLFGSLPPHWEVTQVEPESFREEDERVIVTGHFRCRPRGSWEVLRLPFAHIWTAAQGRVVRVLSYFDGIEIARAT